MTDLPLDPSFTNWLRRASGYEPMPRWRRRKLHEDPEPWPEPLDPAAFRAQRANQPTRYDAIAPPSQPGPSLPGRAADVVALDPGSGQWNSAPVPKADAP